jgi:hypothetical protein
MEVMSEDELVDGYLINIVLIFGKRIGQGTIGVRNPKLEKR